MRRYFLLFFLIQNFVIINQLPAQQIQTLTYEDAINIALKKSYTIKSYLENKIAMQQYYYYSKADFKPRLDFNLFTPSWNENVIQVQKPDSLPVNNSYGEMRYDGGLQFTYMLPTGGNFALSSRMYRNDIKNVFVPQGQKDYVTLRAREAHTSLSISFNQPIFTTNILREGLNKAKYRYEQSSSRFTRGQMDIIYMVTRGFYFLYRATRQVEIADEKLKNSEEAYRIGKLKGEAGRIPEGDVLIAEVAAAQDKANLSEAIGSLEREEDDFKQLIGLDLNEKIQILTDLKYDTFAIDLDKAIEEALKNRLEINESELDIKIQKIEVDRAKREREFSGNISAYYDITGVSTLGKGPTRELFESSFENFIDRPPNRGIILSFSYPIFDWGRGSAIVQAEKANLRRSELDLEDTKITIIRQVRDVVRSVEEAKNRLKINEKNQEVAQRSYEISRMRFENGDITSQELGVEQERLATTQLNYLDAFITYQLALADLKRKTLWDFQNNRSYLKDEYLSEK